MQHTEPQRGRRTCLRADYPNDDAANNDYSLFVSGLQRISSYCDTRYKVASQVRENILAFMPGGGYVFNNVHNIQGGFPPENIGETDGSFQVRQDIRAPPVPVKQQWG